MITQEQRDQDTQNRIRLVQQITQVRKASGLSQRHVGRILGTSGNTVSGWERTSRGKILLPVAQRYARATGSLRTRLIQKLPKVAA